MGLSPHGETPDASTLPSAHDAPVGIVSWAEFAGLASAPVTVALRGRVASADEPAERLIFAPPDFWRVTDDHGRLRYLANETGHYRWRTSSGELAGFEERRPGCWTSGGVNCTDLVRARELVNPIDDDFTRPAGPVQEIVFIGRPAWRVLLAPPPHKPQPVWQILDVRSGVTLAYQSPDGPTLIAFTSLATDIDLPPETFAAPPDGT
jgi:hypothetical protein